MPKITEHGGPSYAGHTDITPHDVTEPLWVPAPGQPEPVTEPVPVAEVAPTRAGRPTARTRTRKAGA